MDSEELICFLLSQGLIGLPMMLYLASPMFFVCLFVCFVFFCLFICCHCCSFAVLIKYFKYLNLKATSPCLFCMLKLLESAELLIPPPMYLHLTSYRGHFFHFSCCPQFLRLIRRLGKFLQTKVIYKLIILFPQFYLFKSHCCFCSFLICLARVDM